MGLEQVARCDIYGTYNDVKHVKLTILVESAAEREVDIYMSPRAIKRLDKLLGKALSKPGAEAE